MSITEIRKSVINVATAVVAATPWILQAEGVVHLSAPVVGVISLVLGAAGAVVHYLTPNVTSNSAVAQRTSAAFRPAKAVRRSASKPGGRKTPPRA